MTKADLEEQHTKNSKTKSQTQVAVISKYTNQLMSKEDDKKFFGTLQLLMTQELQFIVHHDKILQLATYVLGQLPPALSTEEQEEKAREAEEMKSMIRDSEKVTTAADVNESEVKKIAAETIDRDIGKQSSNADDSYAMEQHFPPCNVCAEVESKIGLMKVDSKISDKRRRALANHYVKFDLEKDQKYVSLIIDLEEAYQIDNIKVGNPIKDPNYKDHPDEEKE